MPPPSETKRLRWDPTITAGNLITAATTLFALLAWGFAIEAKVGEHDRRIDVLESERRRDNADAMHTRETLAGLKAEVTGVREGVARIENRFSRQER